jgi:hypothetical protein
MGPLHPHDVLTAGTLGSIFVHVVHFLDRQISELQGPKEAPEGCLHHYKREDTANVKLNSANAATLGLHEALRSAHAKSGDWCMAH